MFVLGKTYPITKKICSKIDASYGIFGNGSQIIDLRTGNEIYKNLLTKSDVLACIDIARKNNLHVHLYTNTEVISEKLLYLDLRNYKLQNSDKIEVSMKFKITHDIKDYVSKNNIEVCKLVISSDSSTKNVKQEIENSLNVLATTISKFGIYKDNVLDKEYEYLDITPKSVNKDTALKFLGNYLKINSDEMLTIGDNLNDLDMVKNAGVGVAVANAYDELKNVAKYVTTKPVDKGGFAEAVYKFVKI